MEGANGVAEVIVGTFGVDADGVSAVDVDIDGGAESMDAAEILGNGHHADIGHEFAEERRIQNIGLHEDIRGFGTVEIDGDESVTGDMIVIAEKETAAVAHGIQYFFVFHGDAEDGFAIDKGNETGAIKENAAEDSGTGVAADPAVVVG